MRLVIEATPKEIADLVLAVQSQHISEDELKTVREPYSRYRKQVQVQ